MFKADNLNQGLVFLILNALKPCGDELVDLVS